MEEEQKPTVEALLPAVYEEQARILTDLVAEQDVDRIKDHTHLFNAYLTKRQALRMNALNDVQDALVQQMLTRLSKTPDNFANGDVATWMKVVQGAMDSMQKTLAQVDELPTIVNQQNNQININVAETLSRESRERIAEAIKALMEGGLENEDGVYAGGDTSSEGEEEVGSTLNEDKLEDDSDE